MAKTAALQRAELDAHRQALRARVADARRKVAHDRSEVASEARRLAGSESPMAEHPKTTVAASAAAGFVAARVHVPRPHVPTAPLGKVASKGAGVGANVLKVEAGVVLKDFVDGLFRRGEEGSAPAQA